jgi:hypothetical protein
MDTNELMKLQLNSLEQISREHEEALRDALTCILWLYRRLPRAYESVPSVNRTIENIGKHLDIDVKEFIMEREE